MDLFKLRATLGLDASEYDKGLDRAKGSLASFGSTVTNCVATLAKLGAAAVGVASTITTALGSAAVKSYAEYEQLTGGVETLFGKSADKVMEYAQNAYKTAGMSTNQYMSTVTSFAASLIQSTKNNMVKLSDEEIEARKDALDKQYDLTKDAADKEYDVQKKSFDKQYDALKKFLDKQYDARKKELDKQYDALSDALDDEINAMEKSHDKTLSDAEKSYDADVRAYEKATEEKIALIDEEYKERLKLINEEEYNRLKAIDDQIDALNAQTEQEQKAQEEAEREQKRAELQKAINTADSVEERQKAQEALAEFNARIAQKEREEQRKEQIKGLKEQKTAVKEEINQKKEAAKEKRDEAVNSVKEESKETLVAMKESHKAEMDALKESQRAEIESMRESKKEQLSTLKEAQSEELDSIKESNSDQLDALKESQSDQLKEFKKAQDEKLKVLKKSLDEQKKAVESQTADLKAGASDSGENMAKAAELADMALRDMSDNVNKMGSSMDSVQNAYMGFSKQNFTMLDNLKLGYGGTKEEMERLLRDAEQLEGLEIGTYDTNSFADIVNAIHTIQSEMGITGTTAKEAEGTISGSLAMTKASWDNLIAGLSNPDADLGALVDQLVKNAETSFDNIEPAIERALFGIGNFVDKIAPIIIQKLPTLVGKVAPPLTNAAVKMVTSLGQALIINVPILLGYVDKLLGKFLDGIQKFDFKKNSEEFADKISGMFGEDNLLSKIIEKGAGIIASLVSGIGESLPSLIPAAVDVITSLANDLADQIPTLINSAVDLIIGLATGLTNPKSITEIVDTAIKIVQKLADGIVNALPKLTAAAPTIIQNLVTAIANNLPKLLVSALKIVVQLETGIIKNLPTLAKAAGQVIVTLVNGLAQYYGKLLTAGFDIVKNIKEGIGKLDPVRWGKDLIKNFIDGIKEGWDDLKSTLGEFGDIIADRIGFSEPKVGVLSNFHTYAPDMMELFTKGIRDNEKMVQDQIDKSFDFSDIITDQAINVNGTTNFGAGSAANTPGGAVGGVVINVYGAEGQSEERLAEIVSERLNHELYRTRAAFA